MNFGYGPYYMPYLVPWESPQLRSGVWYPPFFPFEAPIEGWQEGTRTPIQALDTSELVRITPQELAALNPPNYSVPPKARFFVMRAECEDDVHKSLKYGIWTSPRGNSKLDKAFSEGPVVLVFSVKQSGIFLGVAEMVSCVDFHARFTGWYPQFSNLGFFKVKWVFVKDVPDSELKEIRLRNGMPIHKAFDATELPNRLGCKLIKIFGSTKSQKSLLDDFNYYDVKEVQVNSFLQ